MIRALFLIILSLCGLVSSAQRADTLRPTYYQGVGLQMKVMRADSVAWIPTDTTYNKTGIARKGSSFYVGNGSYWVEKTGGGGGGTTDTTSLSNRINLKVNISDTAAMLLPYLKKIDTTALVLPYLRKVDTTAMLMPYLRKIDTTIMLSVYLRKIDTTSMLSKYLRKIDTASLSNRIDLKLDSITKNHTADTFYSWRNGVIVDRRPDSISDNAIRRSVYTFHLPVSVTSNGLDSFDIITPFVDTLFLNAGGDSLVYKINGRRHALFLGSGGGGSNIYNTDGTITDAERIVDLQSTGGILRFRTDNINTPAFIFEGTASNASADLFELFDANGSIIRAGGSIQLYRNTTAQSDFEAQAGVIFTGVPSSHNADDSMLVRKASDGTVGYRPIPSGGGSSPWTDTLSSTAITYTGDTYTNGKSNADSVKQGGVAVKPYKVYVALLTQLGTDPPTVEAVLENTIGVVTYSYDDVGQFNATCTGCFTTNKTTASGSVFTAGYTISFDVNTDTPDNIRIRTFAIGPVDFANDGLDHSYFEIRVYQ